MLETGFAAQLFRSLHTAWVNLSLSREILSTPRLELLDGSMEMYSLRPASGQPSATHRGSKIAVSTAAKGDRSPGMGMRRVHRMRHSFEDKVGDEPSPPLIPSASALYYVARTHYLMYAHRSGLARAWLGFRGAAVSSSCLGGSWGVGTVRQRSQVFHPRWRIDYVSVSYASVESEGGPGARRSGLYVWPLFMTALVLASGLSMDLAGSHRRRKRCRPVPRLRWRSCLAAICPGVGVVTARTLLCLFMHCVVN